MNVIIKIKIIRIFLCYTYTLFETRNLLAHLLDTRKQRIRNYYPIESTSNRIACLSTSIELISLKWPGMRGIATVLLLKFLKKTGLSLGRNALGIRACLPLPPQRTAFVSHASSYCIPDARMADASSLLRLLPVVARGWFSRVRAYPARSGDVKP